ncbi:MT-A70 family methyltransferase [Candidatus Binatia bacterium]|nr:MT-A70 family methyltransferase [Candidatus Binatia bacterium]
MNVSDDLRANLQGSFGTILADPPWRFENRTGKMAPEHRRLRRYETMSIQDIKALPVSELAAPRSHLYLWTPNALLQWGLDTMSAWGFTYKGNLVWYKVRYDGGPDGRGVGFYFRNVTELVLFGVRGNLRTKAPGRRQVNLFASRKREHSCKPDQLYDIIEDCSPGPFLELFARHCRDGWEQWGDELEQAPHRHLPIPRRRTGASVPSVGPAPVTPRLRFRQVSRKCLLQFPSGVDL